VSIIWTLYKKYCLGIVGRGLKCKLGNNNAEINYLYLGADESVDSRTNAEFDSNTGLATFPAFIRVMTGSRGRWSQEAN